MLIVSKFVDYYDCIQAMGVDKKNVYKRKTVEFKSGHLLKRFEGLLNLPLYSTFYKSTGTEWLAPVYVVFCGRVYVGAKHCKFSTTSSETKFVYGFNRVNEYIDKHNLLEETRKSKWYRRRKIITISDKFKRSYDFIDKKECPDVFEQYRSPILIISPESRGDHFRHFKHQGYINPNLSEVNFQSVFDPYTAYQEIQMYIGGVLGLNKPDTLDIEDKYRIANKGYDKWSFRKQQHQSKPRGKECT